MAGLQKWLLWRQTKKSAQRRKELSMITQWTRGGGNQAQGRKKDKHIDRSNYFYTEESILCSNFRVQVTPFVYMLLAWSWPYMQFVEACPFSCRSPILLARAWHYFSKSIPDCSINFCRPVTTSIKAYYLLN